jgi:hypothetical protein
VRHDEEGRRAWLGWALRIRSTRAPAAIRTVPLDVLARPASMAARAIPPILIVVGLSVAILSATVIEEATTEGIATLGVEAGAALWFGGAVAWSLQRTTVGRALLVIASAVAGIGLITLALTRGWSGPLLDLSMEFGVGALAIVVIDVVVLGALRPGLDAVSRRADQAWVDIELGWRWPPLTVRAHPRRAGNIG